MTRRRLLTVVSRLVFTVALAVLGVGAAALPAAAADCAGVSDWSHLSTAFDDGGTVTLCQSIPASSGQRLTVGSAAVTLDLNGFDLTITSPGGHDAAITVPSGDMLTIEDTSTGAPGTLTATGHAGGAGIGGGEQVSSGSVTIKSGIVTATGGGEGAGIGGGNYGDGGPVTISGGAVTATGDDGGAGIGGGNGANGGPVSITGGTVTATGGSVAAGIGGGYDHDGGTVTIKTGASVTAAGGATAVGGSFGASFGSLSNSGTLILASDLAIPQGVTVTNDGTITTNDTITVDNDGTIKGSGTLGGAGTIDNGGAIWRTLTVDGSEGLTVTDHHYQLTFDADAGSTDWNGATPWSVLDGPTLESVGRSVDDLPSATRDGYTFTGWYLTSDADGSRVAGSTTLSNSSSNGTVVGVTLYAGWVLRQPVTVYAYPHGAADQPQSCPRASNLSDACTLGQALGLAQSGDSIILAADPGSGGSAAFTTDDGWMVDQDSLTIEADHGVDAILDGHGVAPYLLYYRGNGALIVSDLTVKGSVGGSTAPGGNEADGGGIVNNGGGHLQVVRSTFTGNTSTGPGGYAAVFGGGIENVSGTATVTGSTFTGNTSTGTAGAIVLGGGIVNRNGSIAVDDSTFTGNTTTGAGGFSLAAGGGFLSDGGTATVIASTFVDNGVGHPAANAHGGGLVTLLGSVSVAATMLAGDDPSCAPDNGASSIVDLGYNIDDDGSCGFAPANGSVSDSSGLAATLNPLADNGGPTATIAPKPGSPAVEMIPTGASVSVGGNAATLCPTTDQRGVASADDTACNAGSVQSAGPLRITTTSLSGGQAGTAYHPPALAATGGIGSYTWAVTAGTLPTGLALDAATGAITGTPQVAGSFSLTVQVTDGATATATRKLSITVAPGPAAHIAVNGGDGQSADTATDFAASLSVLVTDTDGNPAASGTTVTFTVTSGDATFLGHQSATAQTGDHGIATAPTLTAGSTAGPVTVQATVADVNNPATFAETVTATQTPPSSTTPTTPPTTPAGALLIVETTTLSTGAVGSAYHDALQASGAPDAVYHWTLIGGALPDGLHLSDSGIISGTPTTEGTFTFTVSVNDPATATLTIVIQPAAGSPASASSTERSTKTRTETRTESSSESTSGTNTASSTGPATMTVTPPTAPTAGTLSQTGVPGMLLPAGIAALVLILAGGLIVASTSRQRRRQH